MRRTWVAFAVVGIAGAVSASFFGLRAWRTRQANLLWSRFATCLIGPPLRPGESLPVRVNGIRRASRDPKHVFANPADDPHHRPENAWPDRCAPLLLAVAQSEAALSAAPKLGLRADEVFRALRRGDVPASLHELWADASAFPFAEAAAGVQQPPAPQPVLAKVTPGDKTLMPGTSLSPANRYADSPFPLVFGEGNLRCTMAAGLSAATCAPVSSIENAKVRFIPSPGGLAWVVATPLAGVLHAPDGRKLAGPLENLRGGDATNVRVHANGSFTDLSWAENDKREWSFRLQRWSGDLSVGTNWLPPASRNASLVDDFVTWLQDDRLHVAPLLDDPRVMGESISLGRFWKGTALRVCGTTGITFVLAIHPAAPGSTAPSLRMDLYRITEKGWTGPESLDAESSGDHSGTAGPVSLSCRAGSASIGWSLSQLVSWVDRHEVHLSRCDAQSCRREKSEVQGLGATASWYNASTLDKPGRVDGPLVLDFGDSVALLWNGGGAARVRVGSFRNLAAAPETALIDTLGGEYSFDAVVRENKAVVIANDGTGGRIFSIEAQGTVSAVTLTP